MADNAEGAPEAPESQVSFRVKTSGEGNHQITMSESATVLDLKTKLAGEDYENIPVERQRLIYSGRVMKNDDPLSTYKIKNGNTVHMVKSAASNPAPPPASSSSAAHAPAAVPANMSAGTANDILAGLTGARFAGHVNLPPRETFGPDGGMGPPPGEERLADLLNDPAAAQAMNAALDNPQFLEYLIQSHPHLRNTPNVREIIQSPLFRSMMTNPDLMRQMIRMQRSLGAGGMPNPMFPAPGATDTTPAGAPSADGGAPAGGAQSPGIPPNPFAFPFGMMPPFPAAGAGTGAGADANAANPLAALFAGMQAPPPATAPSSAAPASTPGSGAAANPTAPTGGAPAANPAANNPFAALMNPANLSPEMMAQMMQMWGPPAPAAAPPDTRPPEERYAEQLRQLNDMGFHDFDRNIAALRRSGGSVQGAIEYLLS
jgi:ubiquilin